MIQSFRDKLTAAVFQGEIPRQMPAGAARAAHKTLLILDRAVSLQDLKSVSLSLEALKHDRLGQHSIRASRGWRICFRWEKADAYDVEVTKHYR